MNKKAIALLSTLLFLSACSSAKPQVSETKAGAQVTTTVATATEATKPAKVEAGIGKKVSFKDHDIVVTKIEKATDFEGKPCILITYDFTNQKDDEQSAMVLSNFEVYQDGAQLEVGIVDLKGAGENLMKKAKKGTTIKDCKIAYKTTSDKDIEINIKPAISFDKNEKATFTVPMPK